MRTFAITSGKGGVGKTTLTANLGVALAQQGSRVVLFDADLGLANLDIVLGVRPPFSLPHVVREHRPLNDVLFTCSPGLRLISGGSGVDELVAAGADTLDDFLRQICALETDTDLLVFDTGAGIGPAVMRFLEAADEVILVLTPDPTSAMDAYATVKLLASQRPGVTVQVIVNQADSHERGRETFERLAKIVRQFLDADLALLGVVRQDLRAAAALRGRVPVVNAEPKSAASTDILAIASRLSPNQAEKAEDKRPTPPVKPTDTLLSRLRGAFGGFGKKAA